jgi:two-component sensor histidine kinase
MYRHFARLPERALLEEADHRFSSHLSMLEGVLDREPDQVSLQRVRPRVTGRIAAFARLHRLLAIGDAASAVDAGAFLEELCGYLRRACLEPYGLAGRVQADHAPLPADTCRHIGLIVNELVTNAAKHAFPNRSTGCVTVMLRCRAGSWTVAVADDGVGIKARPDAAAGAGLMLVRKLVDTLGARCVCRSTAAGTTIALRFHADHRG